MTNPLLKNARSDEPPRFSEILPEHVVPALTELLAEYDRDTESALSADGAALARVDALWGDRLDRAWSPVSHLQAVRDSDDMRPAYQQGIELLTEHATRRQQDHRLFEQYRALGSADHDDPALARIVELELREFRLAGVDLPDDRRDRLREVVVKLSELGNRFTENLQDATRAWQHHVTDDADLAGLPEAERELLAGLADERDLDGWLIDLSEPAYHAILTYADDRSLRQSVYRAYATRASDQGPNAGEWDNAPVMDEILALRSELAGLLGFSSYADYALERRMATSADEVLEFLKRLAALARPAARQQYEELQAYARRHGAPELEPWDIAYWSEKLRRETLEISDEALKPWLPAEAMMGALWDTLERLFGLTIERDDSVPTWHPDVRYVWLIDASGERVGGLYLDLYARRNKRGGAWMNSYRTRIDLPNVQQRPVAFLTCNFPPPGRDRPSLLTHGDVETLFHEFGHCLHHLLTRVGWPQVNGLAAVEWDAVELPSQLLENWCWSPEVLQRHARHHETGEPLPEDLMQRLLASRQFQKGLWLVRQLEYAMTDMALHAVPVGEPAPDPQATARDVHDRVGVTPMPDWNRFLNGFGHIFAGGYAAGYYSYLWAEQLSADAWERFDEAGLFDAGTAAALRDEILAVGAARPAAESFIAFRGRPPKPEPLLRLYGLAVEPESHA